MQVGNSRVLDVEYINNIFACVSPTLKEHFKNGLQADFSTSACFVEGSLDEDRLRCTLLPDGVVGKIKCAFSFKNSGSPNHQFTCCDGLKISTEGIKAWWKNKRGLDLADIDIVLEVWYVEGGLAAAAKYGNATGCTKTAQRRTMP
jgi:hypothetical protein